MAHTPAPQLCSGARGSPVPPSPSSCLHTALCRPNHQPAPPVERATGFSPVPSRHLQSAAQQKTPSISDSNHRGFWLESLLASDELVRSVLPLLHGGEWRCWEHNCKPHSWAPQRTQRSYQYHNSIQQLCSASVTHLTSSQLSRNVSHYLVRQVRTDLQSLQKCTPGQELNLCLLEPRDSRIYHLCNTGTARRTQSTSFLTELPFPNPVASPGQPCKSPHKG